MTDRKMQFEFSEKIVLKSWDDDFFENGRQTSLTQILSEVWFFFMVHMALFYSAVDWFYQSNNEDVP